jgi:hypothetical protein
LPSLFILVTLFNESSHFKKPGVRVMQENNRNAWNWGFTTGAENWNGRLAMVGFAAALIIELVSGQGLLHFWGLL